jgi:outer membrane protein W
MKKLSIMAILAIVIFLTASLVQAETQKPTKPVLKHYRFSFSVGAGSRSFTNELYKEVYGKSSTTYNVDLGYQLIKNIEAFLHTDYFKKDGFTTYTKDASTLKITPIEFGMRYLVILMKKNDGIRVIPYVGAGLGYYSIKEDSIIGSFKQNRTGFLMEFGLRTYVYKSFFIDLKGKNVSLKTKVTDQAKAVVKLGGFSYMGGIGLSF